jgi:hypothetical protein
MTAKCLRAALRSGTLSSSDGDADAQGRPSRSWTSSSSALVDHAVRRGTPITSLPVLRFGRCWGRLT